MKCPKCGAESESDAEHCTQCGAKLETRRSPGSGAGVKVGDVGMLKGDIDASTSVTKDDHSQVQITSSQDDHSQVSVRKTEIGSQEVVQGDQVAGSKVEGDEVAGDKVDGDRVGGAQLKAQTINVQKKDEYVNCVICGRSETRAESRRCPSCSQFVCSVHFDGLKNKCARCIKAQGAGRGGLVVGAAVAAVLVLAVVWRLSSPARPSVSTTTVPSSVTTRSVTPTTILPPTTRATTIPAKEKEPELEQPEAIKVPGVTSQVEQALRLVYTTRIENPTPSAAIEVMVQPAAGGDWRPLRNGEKLSSADTYSIRFEPDDESHFYVFQIDTTGKLDWIFPKNSFEFSFGSNPVSAGTATQVPDGDQSFFLDESLGVEHLYIVATRSRWDALEQALETARKSGRGTKGIQSAFGLATRGIRGVGGIRPTSGSGGTGSTEVRQLITGKLGVLVEERWFFHVAPPK